jgi:AcrR family transcriptional regulator
MSADPRVLRSRAAVLDAARELLIEFGIQGVTIEGVASRSGVAKTTIYRQWTDRNQLLLDACTTDVVDIVVPNTDDLRADILTAVTDLASLLDGADGTAMMPALIEAAERDEEFRDIIGPFVDARRQPVMNRLRSAVRRGQLPKGTDVDMVCASLVGPLFYRRLLTRQRVGDPKALRHGVDIVLTGARAVFDAQ